MTKVTLYQHDNFKGDKYSFETDVYDLGLFFYWDKGLHDWNDAASSLKISLGTGLFVTFYEDINMKGNEATLGPGDWTLSDLIDEGLHNDKISSFDIWGWP